MVDQPPSTGTNTCVHFCCCKERGRESKITKLSATLTSTLSFTFLEAEHASLKVKETAISMCLVQVIFNFLSLVQPLLRPGSPVLDTIFNLDPLKASIFQNLAIFHHSEIN